MSGVVGLAVALTIVVLPAAALADSCNIDWSWEYNSLATNINDWQLPANKQTREWIELDVRSYRFASAAERAQSRALELEQRLPAASRLIACALSELARTLGSRAANIWRVRAKAAEFAWDLLESSAMSFYYSAGELYYLNKDERKAVELMRKVVEVGVTTKLMPGLVEKARFALEDIEDARLRRRERKLERIQEEIIGLLDALTTRTSPLKTE